MKKEIYQLTYDLEENYWWYASRRKIIIDQLQSLNKRQKDGNKQSLLDFGCGTGINLVHFSQTFDAFGADFSIDAIRFCKQRGLKNVRLLRLSNNHNETNPFNKDFDFITLLDVLEHIKNEKKYLSILSNWLKESGILFLTVPAYQWLWSGEDNVSLHIRRYTKKQLTEVIEESGFKIVKISYFNTLLFPFQAITILLKRLFSPTSQNKTNLNEMPNSINRILEKIMSFESNLLMKYNLPFGGSILCICRKS